MTNNENVLAQHSHTCGIACLGPLTFHPGAVGKKITLSHGGCRASRDLETFQNGLVFSSRPIRLKEKVHFRVERTLLAWHGAVRIGFTNVCPTTGPLPSLAVPDLTNKPGYAAFAVPHKDCTPGTTVTFWMSSDGRLCYKTSTRTHGWVQTDLDLTQPLWAIFDVYGQSTTVLLLGSETGHLFRRTSCPLPRSTFECGYEETPPELQRRLEMAQKNIEQCLEDQGNNPCRPGSSAEDLCSVCLQEEARLALRCGHRCLCLPCANRVFAEFGTCPLCRQSI
ncbi:hypothetical protein ACEWY4_019760 [Coilia grayii]|uniref:E3 ubiquitin-protein ligase NEURL3 n=1 Tax=Coilia grayii TaxID=363190 RepID=A0ABD1JAR3_9TELE